MSTGRLLLWAALVAGVELAVRGHLVGDGAIAHGGALLAVGAALGLAWRPARRRALVAVGALAVGAVAIDAALGAPPTPHAAWPWPGPAALMSAPDAPRPATA